MMQRVIRALRRNEGFTLLEVLVVIAILGIIAALITPKFLDTMAGARSDTAIASGKQIQAGLERYNFKNNAYPAASGVNDFGTLGTAIGKYVTMTTDGYLWSDYHSSTSAFTLKLYVKNSVTSDNNKGTCLVITQDGVSTETASAVDTCTAITTP